jgi:hypothetical protein
MTAKKIKELAKACYLYAHRNLFSSFDLHQYIAEHARYIGLAPPTSLIFADTNWSNQYFGFVVNPGTARLELWNLDRSASQGKLMSDWKEWVNGAQRANWTLYVKPSEYASASAPPSMQLFGKV